MARNKRIKPNSNQLTPRQVALARNLLNGATITEAAITAGYSGKNPAQSGHQALGAIRLRAPELLDEFGVSLRTLIAKHLVPQLSATTTKFLQRNGKVTASRRVADNSARLRALDMAFRLLGAYPPGCQDRQRVDQVGVKVIILDAPRPPRPPIKQPVIQCTQ